MAKAYRIKGWNDLYENNKSREVEMLTYFLHPNKLVGEGLGFLKQQPDWLELYGVFGFFKMLASLSERRYRGWLVRSGTPLDAPRICALTGIPVEKVQRALEFFSTPPMDWLPREEMQSTPPGQRVGTSSTPPGQHKGSISPGLRTDIGLTEVQGGKKRGDGSGVAASRTQFVALKNRIQELEKLGEGDRTEEQEVELGKKKMALRELQKKQAAGDFTPVSASAE